MLHLLTRPHMNHLRHHHRRRPSHVRPVSQNCLSYATDRFRCSPMHPNPLPSQLPHTLQPPTPSGLQQRVPRLGHRRRAFRHQHRHRTQRRYVAFSLQRYPITTSNATPSPLTPFLTLPLHRRGAVCCRVRPQGFPLQRCPETHRHVFGGGGGAG